MRACQLPPRNSSWKKDVQPGVGKLGGLEQRKKTEVVVVDKMRQLLFFIPLAYLFFSSDNLASTFCMELNGSRFKK